MNVNISKRDSTIVKEYLKKNTTMQKIADDYNLSRQRVEQILRKNNVPKKEPKQIVLKYTCEECKKNFETTNTGRKYCSVECSSLGRRKYRTKEQIEKHIEELRIKNIRRANLFYHNVFKKKKDWKEIVKIRNSKIKK